MTLPELVEWRRMHPDAPRLSSRSVNKQLGGVQAIVNWAREKGMIPEPLWVDPFSNMRVDEDDPESGPFEPDELGALFASPIFTAGERPEAGQGDVAFWLPLLALFTGARRAELTMLKATDISKDALFRAAVNMIGAICPLMDPSGTTTRPPPARAPG